MGETAYLSFEQAIKTDRYCRALGDIYVNNAAASIQSLFARCCLATTPGFNFDLREIAEDSSRFAKTVLFHPNRDELGLDPLLVVQIRLMLMSAGLDVAILRELVDLIAGELAGQGEDTRNQGRVRQIASLLKSLGYVIDVIKPPRDTLGLLDNPAVWLGLPTTQLSDIADHFFADKAGLDDMSSQIMSLVALGELRNYRLDLGCKLLRLVFSQGVICLEANEALNFVALQRRRDGGYGFVNPFLETWQSEGDKALSLHLPATLNAVWLFRTKALRRNDGNLGVLGLCKTCLAC
jgi:hypothetical protein